MKQTARLIAPSHVIPVWLAALYPVIGIAALVCGILIACVLWLNAGTFTYAFDDPYIHLALAHNIALGHYGINMVEPSSPSSSIIWPLLLAPFAATAFSDIVPLLFNLVAASAVLALLCVLVSEAFAELPPPAQRTATIGVVLVVSATMNLFGLIFLGLEHTLQIALSLAILLGLLRLHSDQRLRWWLVAALILAPLVRYECLAFSGVALLYLVWRRKVGAALFAGVAIALLIGGFSVFLLSQGLGPLPSSVVAKTTEAHLGLLAQLGKRFGNVLTTTQGWLLLIGSLLLATRGDRGIQPLSRSVAAAALAHLVIGRIGGYPRYESYLVALVLVMLVLSQRTLLARFVSTTPRQRVLLVAVLVPIVLAPISLLVQAITPISGNNVYEQQYQMGRFVADYWQAPVAVNDLGLVAHHGHQFTLDLWGLGSAEALALRQGDLPDAVWMEMLTSKRKVELVMIYPKVFNSIPTTWLPLGDLRLSKPATTVAGSTVRFYATTSAAAERATPLLHNFAQQLPAGVEFAFPAP